MNITDELRQRLSAVRMLVLDVDGVLTTGGIVYTDSGEESKVFDVKDGLGIRVASEAGLQIALMTGRVSQVVQRRARDLHVQHTLQRVGDKAAALPTLATETGLPLASIAFMGDDLNDREAMKLAGVSIAPADAVPEIVAIADLVTDASGGRGAARQAIEAILRAQDRWEQAVEKYVQGLAERDRARRTPEL